MSLKEYKDKRDFKKTPEPLGKIDDFQKNFFVIQKHKASRLHYDFRFEYKGVLKSFAIPKGPSLNPKDKRLAIETEDHPIDYANFEGTIPEGNYGAGTVIIWDRGKYKNITMKNEKNLSIEEAYKNGHITFILNGEKLKGEFSLIRFKGNDKWLLIKKDDLEADRKGDILKEKPNSVVSNKSIEEILGKLLP
ncbi:MAG: DNA polymerase ligase N-terminal domain-containing protein [Candidatus Lokiarchaeota archaeon]